MGHRRTVTERQQIHSVQEASAWIRRATTAYSIRCAPVLHGRLARDAWIMSSVGSRKPKLGVEIRMGDPTDPVRLYASHYVTTHPVSA